MADKIVRNLKIKGQEDNYLMEDNRIGFLEVQASSDFSDFEIKYPPLKNSNYNTIILDFDWDGEGQQYLPKRTTLDDVEYYYNFTNYIQDKIIVNPQGGEDCVKILLHFTITDYQIGKDIDVVTYEAGMTWKDFVNSDYNEFTAVDNDDTFVPKFTISNNEVLYYGVAEDGHHLYINLSEVSPNDTIWYDYVYEYMN